MSEPITWTNERRRLGELIPWDENPRSLSKEEAERLRDSFRTFGYSQLIEIEPDGTILDGHQRDDLLKLMPEFGAECEVDVRVASRAFTRQERKQYIAYKHKGATGHFDWDDMANLYEPVELEAWGWSEKELRAMGIDFGEMAEKKGAKPNPRILPIDVIYTLQMADCTCCLAVQAGLKYGIQSAHYRLCPYANELGERHKVAFIDNDYFKYDHAVHLKAVRELTPKYATVRDAMTPAQCASAGIEHYSLEQILEWAEELAQHAQNVIVIPKYAEALNQIPDKFMLGYSVPTSHGGTPLPVESFKGRRVHLLGGSWKDQLAHMAVLGDDVVSLDNNHIQNIAKWGQFVTPDGETVQMQEVGYGYLTNVRYAALALSFGAIGAKINELCGIKNPADDGGAEAENG
jgi:hypothetical protein